MIPSTTIGSLSTAIRMTDINVPLTVKENESTLFNNQTWIPVEIEYVAPERYSRLFTDEVVQILDPKLDADGVAVVLGTLVSWSADVLGPLMRDDLIELEGWLCVTSENLLAKLYLKIINQTLPSEAERSQLAKLISSSIFEDYTPLEPHWFPAREKEALHFQDTTPPASVDCSSAPLAAPSPSDMPLPPSPPLHYQPQLWPEASSRLMGGGSQVRNGLDRLKIERRVKILAAFKPKPKRSSTPMGRRWD